MLEKIKTCNSIFPLVRAIIYQLILNNERSMQELLKKKVFKKLFILMTLDSMNKPTLITDQVCHGLILFLDTPSMLHDLLHCFR